MISSKNSFRIIKNDRIGADFSYQQILAFNIVEIDTKMGGELAQIHEIKYTFGRPSWTKLPLKIDEKSKFTLDFHIFQKIMIFTQITPDFH